MGLSGPDRDTGHVINVFRIPRRVLVVAASAIIGEIGGMGDTLRLVPRTTTETASPAFDHFADLLIFLVREKAESYARAHGNWDLFVQTQRISGFSAVDKSWQRAWIDFSSRKVWFRDAFKMNASDPRYPEAVFFAKLAGKAHQTAFKEFHGLVWRAARRGDVEFFCRIAKAVRWSNRRWQTPSLTYEMICHWLHSFLWLMSDSTGTTTLERIVGRPIAESNYTKHRQRLELTNYEVAHPRPIITGMTRNGSFVFQEGWTTLAPTSSR